jgi:uncharacterized protein involved in outer membrane biogenesis
MTASRVVRLEGRVSPRQRLDAEQANTMSNSVDWIADLAARYRNYLLGIIALIMVYAIAGFLLAPWLLKKYAVETMQENFGAELTLADVEINPFVLSLRIHGLELDDPAGEAFASIDAAFINFQLSSLFRWAWTFDEFRVTSPTINLERDSDGALNVARFEPRNPPPPDENEQDAGLPRLLVLDFAITDGVVDWHDAVPPEPVDTRFGPVSVAVRDLSTLPERSGEQAVAIRTETAGTLSWRGSLQLNPLKSVGHAAIQGPHFPLASAYVRHDTGFDIVEGDVDAELHYAFATRPDGGFVATIDHLDVGFRDVLVRTFTPESASGTATADRDILSLPSLKLTGGAMRWPEQTVSIQSIDIDDAIVGLFRDESGALNVVRNTGNAPEATETPAEDPVAQNEEGEPPVGGWDVSLERFAVNRLELALEDHSVQPHAVVGVRSLDLAIKNISNVPEQQFPTTLAIEFRAGGTAALNGNITALPRPLLDFDLSVDGASLAAIQPYLEPLADVRVDSGALHANGHLGHSSEEPLAFEGDFDIVDFLMTETDEGSRLGSWAKLHADNLVFSAAASKLEISEIVLDRPYADILIAEDGSANLGRVQKGDVPATEEAAPERPAEEAAAEPVLDVTVGRVVITDGAADFTDRSLPLPFAAAIASLNGDLTTIATTSREPSTVALEGKVDEFGEVRVSGSVTPLDPALNTDLEVVFQNVEMPKLSAYSIPLAGHKIASGRLDLDLGYQVHTSELVGKNKILLRDFVLGEKVEHPGAMSLPLGLAVALLKGPDGRIDIDLPVRGNVDDPEFSYGGLIWKALANLVIKVVASPFAFLANLVGAESSELEYVSFLEGRADITPPEQEKIAKLAEALALRPQLALEISGVVDREADGLALRTAALDRLIEERIAALGGDDEGESMYAEQQREVLEELFEEQAESEDPDQVLEELRAEFTTLTEPADDEEPQEQFDALAYSNELRRRLVELQVVPDEELNALAAKRGVVTEGAILAIDPGLKPRIRMTEPQEVTAEKDGGVRMQVKLTAGDGG